MHRFSRTRNSLMRNEQTAAYSTGRPQPQPVRLRPNRQMAGGSNTSLSTQSSTPYGGTIQKVSLPKLSPPASAVRRPVSTLIRE